MFASVATFWCDQGCCFQTVAVLKLLQTLTLGKGCEITWLKKILYHFSSFVHPFPLLLCPVALGMYQSFQSKIQSVGIQDNTSWSTGVQMSSSIYSIMCCMSSCKQDDDIFILLHKIHFSYLKSNILSKWSNILCKFYITKFTPVHSSPRRYIPLQPPGQPSHQALLPTLPTTPPGPPSHIARPTCQPALPASSATTVSQALQRASAVLVLLQRLCVWGASQRATPSNILHTQSNILCTPSKFLCTPSEIPHLIFYVPSPIFYINLSCDSVHTLSALPLPPGVVNCGVESPFLVTTWRGTQNTQVLWALDGWVWLMMDECYCMFAAEWMPWWVLLYDHWISAGWMLQDECCGSVPLCHVHTAWSSENVKSWMSSWRTLEVYRFTFFVSARRIQVQNQFNTHWENKH